MPGIASIRRLPAVLIIDDDMVSREVMATVLTMSGYLVQTASSGDESLAILDRESFPPDVILMDTQMPGLSGPSLIRQLRTRTSAAIYAISGSHAPEAVLSGADGFLMKPIGPEALQRVLESHAFDIRLAAAPSRPPLETLLPAINPKILAQFRQLMKESAVREIYAAVLADLEKRSGLLESALAIEDREEIHRIGHSIKGGCGMAGALEAARLGELIEAGGDDLEYIRSLMPHFESAIRNLKRMLEAEFSPQGSNPADVLE